MKNESLLLPKVEPRVLTEHQLLARDAYQKGELPSSNRPPRTAVPKAVAKENSIILQHRLNELITGTDKDNVD